MAVPLPWSHSSLSAFDTCGRQYEEYKVLRNFQDVKNPASLWGDRFHNEAEKYIEHRVQGDTQVLPTDMIQYADYLEQFCNRPGKTLVEQEYGIDRYLRPCPFLGPNVWGRGIIDVLTLDGSVADVDDHKTGKKKSDPQQLLIFALLVFLHHPEINVCHTRFHWLQEPPSTRVTAKTYTRAEMPAMWTQILPVLHRYADAFHSGTFRPRKSGLCRKHCGVSTCEYFGG